MTIKQHKKTSRPSDESIWTPSIMGSQLWEISDKTSYQILNWVPGTLLWNNALDLFTMGHFVSHFSTRDNLWRVFQRFLTFIQAGFVVKDFPLTSFMVALSITILATRFQTTVGRLVWNYREWFVFVCINSYMKNILKLNKLLCISMFDRRSVNFLSYHQYHKSAALVVPPKY